MPESVLSAVQISVIGALAAWMITGFTPLPGRWLRWRMFCRATFTIIELTGTKGEGRETVNVYDYLSPGSFILGPPQLQAILDYLTHSGRYDRIDGEGRVLSARGEQRVEVRNNRVVL
ncbi:hypothetical protein AB0K62_11930 [Streptomyces halstedii]|uniref:hypothetical protein n=1 Tax=Streptomyces TaxID=1883 RepID=UPI0004A8D064|nr:hypothetical protein [Streptomyces sp. NTK 937]KDQ71138.1 hypothetical protein DT87_29220 [Streptomyces sp. NTK 937]WSX34460.1 hypothetical protein OG291_01725 [Streptomyces halstedii]